MKDSLSLKGFIGFSAIYLLFIFLGIEDIAWYLKPLLLPFLLYTVFKTEYFPAKKSLLSALIFSWLGDIVLMNAHKDEMYFIVGLVLFLISHLFYIGLFFKEHTEGNAFKKPLFYLCCVMVLWYLKSMLELLFPTLGELKIPVAIYAIVISSMLIAALKLYFSLKSNSRYFILLGAVSFVVSDSLLAINKFYAPLQDASLWIMLTYLVAQYCITLGVLILNEKK